MRLLITGGCGFLGSNLAADALQRGDDLCVFDNLSRQGSMLNKQWLDGLGEYQFVHGDIRNANDVTRLIRDFRPEAIFHLAGQVAMTTSIADPRKDFEINAGGSLNLLEAVRAHAPEAAVVYSSTNKVYGDLEWVRYEESETRYVAPDFPQGFDEQTPLDFHSPYGCSKGSADQYMQDYARMFGLRTVVFRHSSMYGGRQYATYDQGWIGWFCQQAIETQKNPGREPFTISGNGKQVRDVLHAEDMQRLYKAALDHIDQVQGHVFNIGGGMENSLSLLELFALLERQLDIKLNYVLIPVRSSDQRIFVASLGRAGKQLNWEPRIGSEAGVGKMVVWLQGN